MDRSELKGAREQLILKRNRLVTGLRSRLDAWTEFHEICRAIEALNNKLGKGVTAAETRDSAE